VSRGKIVGSLTLREVIQAVLCNGGSLGDTVVRTMMDDCPLTCSPEAELDEVRRRSRRRRTRRAVGGWRVVVCSHRREKGRRRDTTQRIGLDTVWECFSSRLQDT
jgi:hypothetical protein